MLPGGLNWPLDLAIGGDGNLYVADGTYFYVVAADGSLQTVGMLFSPGYPGFVRGLAPAGPGAFVVTTSGGQIARYRPGDGETDYLADGFDQLYGVAIGPGDTIVFTELGTGRVHALRSGSVEVLASDLRDPVGVAFDSDGRPLVAESGAGRVVRLAGSTETLVDDLQRPQGIAVADGQLYIVDAGAKEVIAFDLASGDRRTIASGLPVGPPPGVEPKPLKGMPPFSGPQGPFAGIAIGPDGTLYVSADGDGSVLDPAAGGHMTVTPADHRYLQVARTLRKEIVDGVYPVGSQLPTEHELCERFAVSRYTVPGGPAPAARR